MAKPLHELMDDYDAERLAEIERDEARRNTPEAKKRLAEKKRREFELGIRQGLWDVDGNLLEGTENDDEDEEE